MARVACAALPPSPLNGERAGVRGANGPLRSTPLAALHSFEPNPSGIGQECPRAATVHWQAESNVRATVRLLTPAATLLIPLQAIAPEDIRGFSAPCRSRYPFCSRTARPAAER